MLGVCVRVHLHLFVYGSVPGKDGGWEIVAREATLDKAGAIVNDQRFRGHGYGHPGLVQSEQQSAARMSFLLCFSIVTQNWSLFF